MKVLADASLPGLAQAFPEPFHLTLYHHPEKVTPLLPGQDVLLCRANLKVNHALLQKHRPTYIATASSGTDHLDHEWLHSQNIQIIDAKGCNARAVADYMVSCLAYLDQQKVIQGNKAGIIGLGKVGTQVEARLQAAGFQTVLYDPLKALAEPLTFQSSTLEELYDVDLLCIHAELHNTSPFPSLNLIDHTFLEQLNPSCVIINAARGGIINEEALLRTDFLYCTDVYCNEPDVNPRIIDKALLCTPHIAGHSLEAKYRAVAMVSKTIHQIAGLPEPHYASPSTADLLKDSKHISWDETVLKIYDPETETQLLKKAQNLSSTFLDVRKKHQQRHDFVLYSNDSLDKKTRLLLGDLT